MRCMTACMAALIATAPIVIPMAQSAGLGFMSNTPLTRLSSADQKSLNESVMATLNEAKDGEHRSWSSADADTDSKRGTTVDLVPTRSYQHGGRACRNIQLSFTSKVQNDRMTPAYCKLDDGSWKLLAPSRAKSKASAAKAD